MKRTIFIFLCFLTTLIAKAQSPQSKLIGNWYAEDLAKSTISIYQDNTGTLFGKIIKSEDKDKIGKIPLLNFKYNSSSKKIVGKIKSAFSPMVLDGEITFINDNQIRLVGSRLLFTKKFILIKL